MDSVLPTSPPACDHAPERVPFRAVDRSDPQWEPAWQALREQLLGLPADHPFVGRTIDAFMLMGARGARFAFKDVLTRGYLHIDLA